MKYNKRYNVGIVFRVESADKTKIYYGITDNIFKTMNEYSKQYKKGTLDQDNEIYEIIKDPGYVISKCSESYNVRLRTLEEIKNRHIQLTKNCINKLSMCNDTKFDLTKIKCNICHGNFTRKHEARHNNTQKHIQVLTKQIQELKEMFQYVIQELSQKQKHNIININHSNNITVNNN